MIIAVEYSTSLIKVTFKHFLVLRFVSTFDMFFSRYDRARKHHKTLSCNFFGIHVSLVHSLTLLLGSDQGKGKFIVRVR